MENDEEDHELVADEVAPTEFALKANTSAESKVFDNSLCPKDCKKNNDSLNSKIKDLIDKFFDANNLIYHYKLALAQVESRLVEYKDREVKYCKKIKTLEFHNESKNESIKILKNKLETLKLEKDGVDGKLAGLLKASKDLDNLIKSQRPSPTVESASGDHQNRNPSISKTVASPITPKPFINFVKPKDSPSKSKTCKIESPKKPPVKVLVYKSYNKTPYELFNGRSPAIGFLKPFGCHVMILNTLENLGKFEEKGDEGYFIGYSMSSKAFRVFNKQTRRVEENLHVEFLENKAIEKGTISTNLLDTKDAASQEMKKDVSSLRYIALPNWAHDALLEFSSSKPQDHCSTEVPKDSENPNPTASTSTPLAGQMETLTVETPIPTVSSPVPTAYSTDSQEPSSDARLISKRVANQEETPSLDNILSLTNQSKDILRGTSNSYESNRVEADISNMATDITACPTPTLRVHKDHPKSQIIVEPKKISDALQDPSWVEAMQEKLLQFKIQNVWTLVYCPKELRPIGTKWVLKNKKDERGIVIRNEARLVAQGHTQEEGIDYDKVFAHVARIKAIRFFLANASFMGFTVYQMDVKSAFLYGTVDEEVLHQATRAWYGTLSKYLLKNGFQRGIIDQTLFIRKQREDFILVQVYVDDIIFGSLNLQLCREFEALMHEKFQMSAMGELNFFLGLQVLHKKDGIFLSQDKYVGDILKKFGYSDVRSSNTPMDKENPWGKDGTKKDVDLHLYRSTIGSLMYLTASIPDIMFSVCACDRYQVTPKECHLHAVKRIFRYLKGHPKLGIWYPIESPFDLVAYSDSDYGGATQDRKSTTRGCQFLGRRLISWQCKKQTIVATSTIEAEYVAAASCCGLVLWIQIQLLDYGYNFMNTKIYIDNNSAICIVKNPVYHSKTKHIEIRHHFIRDCFEKKLTSVDHIPTDENVADLLTKPFDPGRLQYLVVEHAMRCFVKGNIIIYTLFVSHIILGWVIGTSKYWSVLRILMISLTLIPLSKYNANFHPMVDFIKASPLRIKTIDEGTQILATVDGIHRTVTESSLRRNLKLQDEEGIRWKVKDFRGMTFKEVEAKFNSVWKQMEDFIPMGSKEEAERIKRKGFNLEQESAKKQKTSEEVPEEAMSPEEVTEEKVKEMMQVVPIEEVYAEALQVKYPIIDSKVNTKGQRRYWKITRLVKETLSNRPPTSEKEMKLWVELNRMYEPDKEDQLNLHASGEGLPFKEGSGSCDDLLQALSRELLTDSK
uniref:Reverse transcriptase Ty1/copia-type domain-containing protein n=1 Tax=Tanacetum cinerariifolium TaxID=118510 RepID=A0A6L2KNI0_TANCI|nr:hypothetical protein [Tanacetum cinerariifolium]